MNDFGAEVSSSAELERVDRITKQLKDIYESDLTREALHDHFLGNVDDYARDIFAKSGGITIKKNEFDFVFFPVNPLNGSFHITRYIPNQRVKGAIDITVTQTLIRGHENLDTKDKRHYFAGKTGIEKAEEKLQPFI